MIKLIKTLNKKQLLMIIPVVFFILCQVYLDLSLPDYMSEITVLLQSSETTVADILVPGSKMLGCALGSFASAIITVFFVASIASSFSQNIRSKVFDSVMDYGMEEVKRFSVSSLVVRTTNDITNIQNFVAMGLQIMIKSPILAVAAITKIAGKNFTWSIITGGFVVLMVSIILVLLFFAIPKTKILQKLTDKLNTVARENITGVRVIKAFNAEENRVNRFEEVNEELTKTNLFINKLMAVLNPLMGFVMSNMTVAIYLSGTFMISAAVGMDKLDLFSNMVVFSQYSVQVVMAFVMLVMIIIIYPRASVSAARILEVVETESNIIDGMKISESKKGEIEFKNVSFAYPGAEEHTLSNISFKASSGEVIAIIGATASGKTSLVNLINRFYDVTKGEVIIDGVNVRDYKEEFLNEKIGLVPQKAVIFSGTVKSNVKYGSKNKKDKDVLKALDIASATEFVENLDKGINSHIAARGTNISGGQKQRLSIARAVLKDPEILIFDDSFSALDYKTDAKVRKSLKKNSKATTIIVAQRIGTVLNADQILVIDEGNLVGIGKHKDLMKNCEIYQEIAKSQLSERELANA